MFRTSFQQVLRFYRFNNETHNIVQKYYNNIILNTVQVHLSLLNHFISLTVIQLQNCS